MKRAAGIMLLSLSIAGCAGPGAVRAQRATLAVAGATVGAMAGHLLGGGDPAATVAGAAAGGLAGHLLGGEDAAARQAGFEDGYVRGQGDSVKRQYWLRQALERERAAPQTAGGQPVFYVLPGPERTEDGRVLVPHTVSVPVIE